jgi:hypothetical protein
MQNGGVSVSTLEKNLHIGTLFSFLRFSLSCSMKIHPQIFKVSVFIGTQNIHQKSPNS